MLYHMTTAVNITLFLCSKENDETLQVNILATLFNLMNVNVNQTLKL